MRGIGLLEDLHLKHLLMAEEKDSRRWEMEKDRNQSELSLGIYGKFQFWLR